MGRHVQQTIGLECESLLQRSLLQPQPHHLHPHTWWVQPLWGHHVLRPPACPHLDHLHPRCAGERSSAPCADRYKIMFFCTLFPFYFSCTTLLDTKEPKAFVHMCLLYLNIKKWVHKQSVLLTVFPPWGYREPMAASWKQIYTFELNILKFKEMRAKTPRPCRSITTCKWMSIMRNSALQRNRRCFQGISL